MAAGNVNRERYREYTHFLRVSAGGLNMDVAPARLERLRSQVNLERNKFLFWAVFWLIIAMVSLSPVLMLAAVALGLPLPDSIDAAANVLHTKVTRMESVWVVAGAIACALLFVAAVVIAYAPIVANGGSVNDLEFAHRALKDIEKE